MVLLGPGLARRELDAEDGRSKATLYTFLRAFQGLGVCKRK